MTKHMCGQSTQQEIILFLNYWVLGNLMVTRNYTFCLQMKETIFLTYTLLVVMPVISGVTSGDASGDGDVDGGDGDDGHGGHGGKGGDGGDGGDGDGW